MTYRENDGLETRLSNLDFSQQSPIREILKEELADRISDRLPDRNGNVFSMKRTWSMFRNPLPAFVLGFIIALAGFSVAHPGTREAILKSFFKVGKSTFIISGGQTDPRADEYFRERGRKEEEDGKIFSLASIYGGYACGIEDGADPFMKQTPSLKIAASLVRNPLLVPTYFNEEIPVDYQFRKAEILPNGSSALHFGIGKFETRIMQIPVSNSNSVTYSTSVVETQPDGSRVTTVLEARLEELKIGNMSVFWQAHDQGMRRRLGRWAENNPDIEIGRFYWENDGFSFTLDGRFLTRDEGLKIIKSLQPYVVQ